MQKLYINIHNKWQRTKIQFHCNNTRLDVTMIIINYENIKVYYGSRDGFDLISLIIIIIIDIYYLVGGVIGKMAAFRSLSSIIKRVCFNLFHSCSFYSYRFHFSHIH